MQFVIKNPAPRGDDAHRWGDEYFGRALEDALVEAGCTVRQDFWPDWDQGPEDAAVLVLRGVRQWLPPKGGFRILWIISHPTQVTDEELRHYDLILAASRVHARLLASRTKTPVRAALQCVDERTFHPPAAPLSRQAEEREGIVYVANSRGVQRDMGRWLLATGREARIFGRAWGARGLGHLVVGSHLPNAEVAQLYRQSRLVLNDHWLDMRGLGYINNRLFDCLASGTPALTDDSPEVRAIFGDALLYADSAEAFEEAIRTCDGDYGGVLQRADEARQRLIPDFTFRARASELMAWVECPPVTRKPSLGRSGPSLEKRLERLLRVNIGQAECAGREQAERMEQAERAYRQLARDAKVEKEELVARAERAERARDQAQQALADARQTLDETRSELAETRREIEAMRETLALAAQVLRYSEQLEDKLRQVLSSASWRLTAPLRSVTGTLQALLGRRRGRALRQPPQRPPEMEQLRARLSGKKD